MSDLRADRAAMRDVRALFSPRLGDIRDRFEAGESTDAAFDALVTAVRRRFVWASPEECPRWYVVDRVDAALADMFPPEPGHQPEYFGGE